MPFPATWAMGWMAYSGLDRSGAGPLPPVTRADAATYIARLADRVPGLHVVALARSPSWPRCSVATRSRTRASPGSSRWPGSSTRRAQDHALGVGEWNAAADVDAFAAVVAGEVPLTILPDDPVPPGRPDGLTAPVVGGLGLDPRFPSPAFWDLPTAAVFTTPGRASTVTGTWTVDLEDRGRLRRTGDGPVRVVTHLDTTALDGDYAAVFAGDVR